MKSLKKGIVSLLCLAVILAVLPLSVSAETSYRSGDYIYTVTNGLAKITGYLNSSSSVIIPSELDGYSVSAIGNSAFKDKTKLMSVTIPEGVTEIAQLAFTGCTALTSITIPDSVIYIYYNSFSDTAYYNDVSNWENGVLYIGKYLIRAKSDTYLGKYTVKQGTIAIAGYAFLSHTGLSSVILPNSLKTIGYAAFNFCRNLNNISIPDSVTIIEGFAFQDCKFTSITLPNNLRYIGYETFADCKNLKSVIIPSGVTEIYGYAFCGCTNLTSVIIPNSVTKIGSDNPFKKCPNITIYCITGSYTENYCKQNNIPFSSFQIETDEAYRYLANYHPNYLNNSAYNGYISTCQSICNDVVQEYNDTDNFWLSYAESFVNGTSIIIQNLFAKLGLGQSTQDEWLEKNTLEYIKRLQESENIVSESWKSIEKKYKDFKFVIKSVDITDSAILEREKYNFIKEISGRSSCFNEAEATKFANLLIEKQPNGISNFFTKIDYAVDLADILLYSCQMLDIEVSSLELLKNNINSDTPLYDAIEKRIMVIKSNPSGYALEKYLTDEVTDKITDFLDDFVDWSAGVITGTDVSVTTKVVKTVSKILYEYIYGRLCGGVKIDEIYGAIVAYDFYSTTTSSWLDSLNQLCINKLNSTTNSDELLTNFKFMFEARRVALANYIDACIEIEKHDDYTSLLNDIKENTNDNGLLCFGKYINTCFDTLKKDISNGTVSCDHGIFHILKSISPTCTAYGYSETVCDICGYVFQTNATDALGHAYSTQTIAPTCTRVGYTHHLCTRCGASYNDNIVSKLEHCYQTTVMSATCTINGYTVHTCKDCGYYYKDNFVDASGHLYSAWITDIYATPNSSGERHRTCSVCGNVETEEIPQLPALLFAGTSLTLQKKPKVNFAVKKDLIDSNGYTNPFVVFSISSNDITVSDYETNDSYYIFSLNVVDVNQLNDEITATLYATYEGSMYSSNPIISTALNFGKQGCDVNGDESIDIRDLIKLKKLMCNVPVSNESDDVIDFDFNGKLDALDLTYLVKILLFS